MSSVPFTHASLSYAKVQENMQCKFGHAQFYTKSDMVKY